MDGEECIYTARFNRKEDTNVERITGRLRAEARHDYSRIRYVMHLYLLMEGLWDLAGWVKDDAYAFAPVRTSVEPERLDHWLDRAEQFVDIVSGIFPDTFMLWRTLHYCVVDWGWWFLKESPDWVDRTPRAPFHELRIYQMNQAYDRLLDRRPELHKLIWGELLTGHLDEAMDNIHPSRDVGGVLWSDMMLYYMSRLRSLHGDHMLV